MTRRRTAGAIAIGALLALPGVAEAAAKTVDMGIPKASGKKFQKTGIDVNDFFPHSVSIHVGDKVKFRTPGTSFHTLDLPPKGTDPLPLILPNGSKVSGVNDAAGAPFWFNGQDAVGFNPQLLQGNFGKKFKFNNTKRILSGVPAGDSAPPVTVTFTKKGRFTYYCNVHAGMTGVIDVKAKGKPVSSAKADKRAVARQVARSLKAAKTLPATRPPSGTVDVGVAGKHGEEFFGFAPNAVTVAVGGTLRFRMSPGSYDVHTATTGPGNPETEPGSYLGSVSAGLNGDPTKLDPRGVYPSEQPPATGTLTPALHGNGFWNTGVMDTSSASPLPESNAVTFGAPGKYEFYCMIHPFMHLTVTAQ
jgi:plastocyanin